MNIYQTDMLERRIIQKLQIDYDLTTKDFIGLIDFVKNLGLITEYYNLINEVEHTSIYRLSEKFSSLNRDLIVCVNPDFQKFYYFRDGYWANDIGNIFTIKKIIEYSEEFADKIMLRKNFIHDLCIHSYIENFEHRLDNFKAIGINKKQCFDYNKCILRTAVPSDYIHFNLDIELNNNYENEIKNIISNIFPDVEVYNYFIRYASSFLFPGNKDKIFMIWSGSGNNGKSILARLLELTFKEYSVRLPTSLITGRRQASSGATPELSMLKNKLVAFLQEPNFNESINIGIVKELTGNDTIYVRSLYKDGTNIQLKAKIIYTVNSTENIAIIEEAIWNRIIVLPFNVKFVSNPMHPNEKKADNELFNKLNIYVPSFLNILITESKEYFDNGLLNSDIVKLNTEHVKAGNDTITEYMNLAESSKTYQGFIGYMKEFHPGKSVPTANMFKSKVKF